MSLLFRPCAILVMIILLNVLSVPAQAAPVNYDLPAQKLEASLDAAARIGGLNLVAGQNLLTGKVAPPLKGSFEPADALRRLLVGSGLGVSITGSNAVISRQTGEINLEPVKVVGTFVPNGSTDPTATENTGSYTTDLATVGSKIPTSIKDTPQSISVITQQQLHDQNLYDFVSALRQAPGIYVQPTDLENGIAILSRGMPIANYQFDGGTTYTTNLGDNMRPIATAFDMSEYDHLEVLRGADGMFAGAGDPSGTVNLVRKRPLDHLQILGEVAAGSWNNFREMGDITGPLGLDGKLRGRLVIAEQDNDYFYETNSSHGTHIYGVVEADLTPTTLLTLGGSYGRLRDVGGDYAVPLAQNGLDLHLPRSFCACSPWAGNHQRNEELFAKLEQKIADGWPLNISFTTTHQDEHQTYQQLYFVTPHLAYDDFEDQKYQIRQYMLDGNIHGTFKLFGQPQQIVFGGSWQKYNSYWNSLQGGNYGQNPINISNIYQFGPADIPNGFDVTKPRSSPFSTQSYGEQWSAYATARFQPVSFLHLLGGFRLSGYDNVGLWNINQTATTVPRTVQSGIITPYAGLTIDLLDHWSLYYSYTNIFQPQPNDYFGPPPGTQSLPPVEGNEHEVGLKGNLLNDKLNVSLALYQIHQINAAVQDPAYPNTTQVGQWGNCCFLAAGNLLSQGVDVEVTGEILPGWQVAASANYNKNKYDSGVAYGANNATVINTIFPPVMYKLWTTYRLPGQWRDFTVGGGVDGQTTIYGRGTVPTVLNSATNQFVCPCTAYRFRQGPFAVANVRTAWRFLPNWEAAMDLNNLFDQRYYRSLTSPRYGNYYGEPRNVMFTLSAKY